MMHPEAVSSLFPKWPNTLKCRKRPIDCYGSEDRPSKRKEHTFLGEKLCAQKSKSDQVSNHSSQYETIETGPSSGLPHFIKASTSLSENLPQSASSSDREEFSSKDYLEGLINSNSDVGLLQIKQEKGPFNDSSAFTKSVTNTARAVRKSEEEGADDVPLVTTIPISGKEFIASVLATTSEEVSCPSKVNEENCFSVSSSSKLSKDKVIQLSGDHTYFEFKSPKKKVILKITKNPEKPTDKIKSLEELLDILKRENCVSNDACSMIEAFLDLPNGLMRNKSQNAPGFRPQMNYTKGVEKFASTIYFHAPRAYEFVSKIFLLPEPHVLRNTVKVWNYFPGFTQEALILLKNGFCNASYANRLCSVMMVNVRIKEQCDFDCNNGRSIGHIDFGGGQDPQDSDEVKIATDALLFVVVGIGFNWKLPFGYFLNSGLSGEFMKTLVTEAIIALEECNLEVRAIVCDGSGSSVSLSNLFGCKIKVKSFRDIETSFPHPTRSDIKIQLIFDASYGLKLLRNLLADKGSLQSTTYGKIEWRFLSLLLDDSKIESHKRHHNLQDLQEFYRQRMKVKAGCHSIGSSIGKTLELIENQSCEEFQGYSATANFAADIDRAFDTLNSRNPVAPGERSPMYQYTVEEQKESLTFVARRMMGLELVTGKRVVDEGRRMSVISFSSTLKAICQLASDLVNRNILRYLCTYRLNLQHAEMILSCLQRTGNWNGLPSAAEFRKAYKRLIQRASLICNNTAFTNDFEGENITVSQGTIYLYRNDLKDQNLDFNVIFNISCLSADYGSDTMSRAKFISSYVARKLACSECTEILLDDQYGSIFRSAVTGKIHIIPSMYVLKLIRLCEKTLKIHMLQSHSFELEDFVILIFGEYSQLNEDLGIKKTSVIHYVEEPHHVICLTKVIIRTFMHFSRKVFTRFN